MVLTNSGVPLRFPDRQSANDRRAPGYHSRLRAFRMKSPELAPLVLAGTIVQP